MQAAKLRVQQRPLEAIAVNDIFFHDGIMSKAMMIGRNTRGKIEVTCASVEKQLPFVVAGPSSLKVFVVTDSRVTGYHE